MNRGKWKSETDLVRLGAKLAEETGETVQEILNSDEEGHTKIMTLAKVENEARHAEFIARRIRTLAFEQRMELTEIKSKAV